VKRACIVLALLACQSLHTDDTLDDGGSAGGGTAGGSAGGSAGGGASGGAAGGTSGSAGGGVGTAGGGQAGGVVNACVGGSGQLTCDGGWCTLPAPPGGGRLVSVSGAGPLDLWVAGDPPRLLRWNGSQWACAPLPIVPRDVWGDADEAWVVGEGSVLRFTPGDGGLAVVDSRGVGNNTVCGLGGRIFVGTDGGELRSYLEGSGWTTESSAGFAIHDIQRGFAAASEGRVLIRDGGGWNVETAAILELAGVFPTTSGASVAERPGLTFLRVDAGVWAQETMIPTATRVNALSGGAGETYAAGEASGGGGFFARRDPTLGWQLLRRHASVLNDVWVAAGPGAAYVAGSGGEVLAYTPPRCGFQAPPIADDFDGVDLSTRWSATGAGVSAVVSGGVLELAPGPAAMQSGGLEAVLSSPGVAELCVSAEIVRVAAWPDGGEVGVGTFLVLNDMTMPDSTTLKWELSSGRMRAYAGDTNTIRADDPRPMDGGLRFIRICAADGGAQFEYGPDGREWRHFADFAIGQSWLSTIDRVRFAVFNRYGGPVVPARIDNLNRCPR